MLDIPNIFKADKEKDFIREDLGSFTVYLKKFKSNNNEYLVDEDKEVMENNEFFYYLIKPNNEEKIKDVILILHGLNEQRYEKMVPWALNLLKNNFAVVLFPMAFHINRRPKNWRVKESFNKKISDRFIEKPERYFLGGMQSYYDVIDLVKKLKLIEKEDFYSNLFSDNTKVHFLGYSASGYLVLILNLINKENLFSDSKSVIFCSGAPIGYVDPATTYIMNKDASTKLIDFYKDYSKLNEHFDKLYHTKQAFWFKNLFLNVDKNKLDERLKELKNNILVISNTNDTVIKPEGIRENLNELEIIELCLGIHEFPFNNIGYEESYEKAIAAIISNLGVIHYKKEFDEFIKATTKFIGG